MGCSMSSHEKKSRVSSEKRWTLDKLAYFFILSDEEFSEKFGVSVIAAERARRRAGINKVRGVLPNEEENPPRLCSEDMLYYYD